jgi:hypothetical protein
VSASNPLPSRIQASYFLVTGVWPLLNRHSFEAVTGPKADFWLARTVGALVASIGSTLLLADKNERHTPELKWLALSSAAGLGAVDLIYATRGSISKVYLADAAIQALLVRLWLKS